MRSYSGHVVLRSGRCDKVVESDRQQGLKLTQPTQGVTGKRIARLNK